eukprot:219880-Prymnesium_polylepis.2
MSLDVPRCQKTWARRPLEESIQSARSTPARGTPRSAEGWLSANRERVAAHTPLRTRSDSLRVPCA